jgi:hypothetical protein
MHVTVCFTPLLIEPNCVTEDVRRCNVPYTRRQDWRCVSYAAAVKRTLQLISCFHRASLLLVTFVNRLMHSIKRS